MSPLELNSTINRMENDIVEALDHKLRAYMVTLAVAHPVPGYEVEDLLQEMRIKMWEKVRDGKYDPQRTKPITYFSWVFRTTLFNLRNYQFRDCRIDAHNFSNSLDELLEDGEGGTSSFQEERILAHHEHHTFCDMCARLVDPHSEYRVFTMRVYDPTLVCVQCLSERALELVQRFEEYT